MEGMDRELVGRLIHMPEIVDLMPAAAHLSATQDARPIHMHRMRVVHQLGASQDVHQIPMQTAGKRQHGTQMHEHRILMQVQTAAKLQVGMRTPEHQILMQVVEAARALGVVQLLGGMLHLREVVLPGVVQLLDEWARILPGKQTKNGNRLGIADGNLRQRLG